MKQETDNSRMKQDVSETSRTMKPGESVRQENLGSQANTSSARTGKETTETSEKKH